MRPSFIRSTWLPSAIRCPPTLYRTSRRRIWVTAASGRMRPTGGCAPATEGGADFSLSCLLISLRPSPEICHRRRMPLLSPRQSSRHVGEKPPRANRPPARRQRPGSSGRRICPGRASAAARPEAGWLRQVRLTLGRWQDMGQASVCAALRGLSHDGGGPADSRFLHVVARLLYVPRCRAGESPQRHVAGLVLQEAFQGSQTDRLDRKSVV